MINRRKTIKELGDLIYKTEKRIHRAISEDDKDFLTWFFFTCNDRESFMKLFESLDFTHQEKTYLRNILQEMGKF